MLPVVIFVCLFVCLFVTYTILLLLNHTLAVLGPVPHKDSVDKFDVYRAVHRNIFL